MSATACCDVSPIHTTAAEPAGGVVNGVNVVDVDVAGGGEVVVVLGSIVLVVGSDVEGADDVFGVVDEVVGASDVVLVDAASVVRTAVDVTRTELVVVVGAGGREVSDGDDSSGWLHPATATSARIAATDPMQRLCGSPGRFVTEHRHRDCGLIEHTVDRGSEHSRAHGATTP